MSEYEGKHEAGPLSSMLAVGDPGYVGRHRVPADEPIALRFPGFPPIRGVGPVIVAQESVAS